MRPSRTLTLLTLAGLGACQCRGGLTDTDSDPLRVTPAALDFGEVFVGFPVERPLTLTNPNRAPTSLALAVSPPFELLDPPARLAAGDAVQLVLRFAPAAHGPANGQLAVGNQVVALRGTGLAVPTCHAEVCVASTFDPAARACVERPRPDGEDCTASEACFVRASCQSGECVGAQTTCDDGDPCTLDVCGASGCGHLDGLPSCPEPEDPCLVPTCDRATGCGFAPALDGTSCGVRTCSDAHVCIGGHCVVRAAPQMQSCTEVVVGVPAGPGTFDGPAPAARFREPLSIAADARGNWYVLDRCAVRKVSPSGAVMTIAGVVDDCQYVDGAGGRARFESPTGLVFEGAGLIVRDGCRLRRVSLAGVVSTWVGAGPCERVDGIGPAARLGSGGLALEPGTRRLMLFDVVGEMADGGVALREVDLRTGEVSTLAVVPPRTPLPGSVETSPRQDTLVATRDGGLFVAFHERRADASGREVLVQFERSGAMRDALVDSYDLGALAAAPGGVLFTAGSQVALFNGSSVTVVAGTSSGYLDGPVEQARLGWVLGPLAVFDGAVLVADRANADLRLLRGGLVSTLSGPGPDRAQVDGPRATARLDDPTALDPRPDGGMDFLDTGRLRFVDPSGTVTTLVRSASMPVDGPFATALFASPSALVHLGPDLWVCDLYNTFDFTPHVVLRRVDLAARQVTTTFDVTAPTATGSLATNRGGALVATVGGAVWQVDPASGMQTTLSAPATWSSVSSDGVDGWYGSARWSLRHLERDGGFEEVIPSSATGYGLDGPLSMASVGLLAAQATDAHGDVWFLDRNRVRRFSPTQRTVATVFELADQPSGLAVEPGGALLVTVPSAILRLRP